MINTLLNFKIVPYDSTICKFLEENLVYDGTELWKAETYMKVSINLVVAAFLDNKIVGIACMSNTSRMKVFIKFLCTLESNRRQYVGSTLFYYIFNGFGTKEISLEVELFNENAIKFYENLGFIKKSSYDCNGKPRGLYNCTIDNFNKLNGLNIK